MKKAKQKIFYLALIVLSIFTLNIPKVNADVYTPIGGETGEAETARRTYLFYNNESDIESNNFANRQIVKNGESLVEVNSPSLNNGERFVGWYVYENGSITNNKINFANTVSGLTKDEEVKVVAKIEKYYQLNFIDVENDDVVIKTISGTFNESGVTISLDDINNVSLDANVNVTRAQVAWSTTKNGAALTSDLEISNPGVINLYPVYGQVKWLIFDSNATEGEQFTSVAPQYLYGDKKTSEPTTTPTRIGYTFAGWYKDKNCTEKFTFGNSISETTTIYAKWNAGTSEYKIIHWIEVLPDDKSHNVYTDGNFDKSKAKWATKKTVTKTDYRLIISKCFSSFHLNIQ